MEELSKKPVIAVLIPTHNRPNQLLKCLQSLAPALDTNAAFQVKVIVILDGCDEKTWRVAKSFDSDAIMLCEGAGDLFWGGAIAKGMYTAFEELMASAVLWLNDDSSFAEHDIVKIANAHIERTNAIFGANLVAQNLNNANIYPISAQQQYIPVPYLNGNFTLVPRLVYEKIGNIDPGKFPHFADAPYIEMAKARGFQCFVVYELKVGIHYDVLRHLPLFVQSLCQRHYFEFLRAQLFSKKSKWYLPYRWFYTNTRHQQFQPLIFMLIFSRDFIPVFLVGILSILPTKMRYALVMSISAEKLRLPPEQVHELEAELAWMR
jgi:GT2 family glycosyltransferase